MPRRLLLLLLLTACSGGGRKKVQPAPDAAAPAPAAAVTATPVVEDGISVEKHGPITVVRIDPARHRLRVLAANQLGGSRTAPKWAEEFELAAVINASMFHGDLTSISMLLDAEVVNNPRDNGKLGGFFFFQPKDAADPPVVAAGRDCPGVDVAALRARYQGVAQNYRMLGCDGEPLAWADRKEFSAAAIGVDEGGRVVFLHSRTPHVMTDFNRRVAEIRPRIVAAHYVEGGPEASLFVDAGKVQVREVGSFESLFNENDDNAMFWPIPNVIGVSRRR